MEQFQREENNRKRTQSGNDQHNHQQRTNHYKTQSQEHEKLFSPQQQLSYFNKGKRQKQINSLKHFLINKYHHFTRKKQMKKLSQQVKNYRNQMKQVSDMLSLRIDHKKVWKYKDNIHLKLSEEGQQLQQAIKKVTNKTNRIKHQLKKHKNNIFNENLQVKKNQLTQEIAQKKKLIQELLNEVFFLQSQCNKNQQLLKYYKQQFENQYLNNIQRENMKIKKNYLNVKSNLSLLQLNYGQLSNKIYIYQQLIQELSKEKIQKHSAKDNLSFQQFKQYQNQIEKNNKLKYQWQISSKDNRFLIECKIKEQIDLNQKLFKQIRLKNIQSAKKNIENRNNIYLKNKTSEKHNIKKKYNQYSNQNYPQLLKLQLKRKDQSYNISNSKIQINQKTHQIKKQNNAILYILGKVTSHKLIDNSYCLKSKVKQVIFFQNNSKFDGIKVVYDFMDFQIKGFKASNQNSQQLCSLIINKNEWLKLLIVCYDNENIYYLKMVSSDGNSIQIGQQVQKAQKYNIQIEKSDRIRFGYFMSEPNEQQYNFRMKGLQIVLSKYSLYQEQYYFQ